MSSGDSGRPVIVVLMPAFLPGLRYGGPVQSIARIVECLSGRFDFRILTSDTDLGADGPYPNVPTGKWIPWKDASVRYLTTRERLFPNVWSLALQARAELLYINSVFHPSMSSLPLLARRLGVGKGSPPTLVAPRGELLPGALALKARKKRAFLLSGKAIGLWSHVSWHATSTAECEAISNFAGGAPVHLAQPLSDSVDRANDASPPAPSEFLRVLFASRIARMKNLDFALQAVLAADRRIELTIAGPLEDLRYWGECEARFREFPERVKVRVLGGLSREQLDWEYRNHDALLLPTRGENFGHVIAEALARGLPVVISDQTVFNSLGAANAGWDLALTSLEPWAAALRVLADESFEQRSRRRASVLAYARQNLDISAAVSATERMFQRAMEAE